VDGLPEIAGAAQEMAEVTLRRMADGGIRDHIGGGFHRYATDDIWLVPHFEKMLYDNALLARVYVRAAHGSHDPRWREVAEQTLDFLVREMELPGGGFAAAQDADSPGGEGAFFVWTPEEIDALLPPGQARAVKRRFGVTAQGNFEGRTILHAALPLPMLAEELGADPEPLLRAAAATLYAARARRPAPARDDKLIAAWNGLAIAAFADAGLAFGRQDYLDAAARAAARILEELIIGGRLHRTLQDGVARHLGQLEDYADVILGLVQLYAATFESRWLVAARRLSDDMIGLFADVEWHGFFATGADAPALLVRMRDLEDQPTPSGSSQAAFVLVRLAGLTGRTDYLELAERTLAVIGEEIARLPLAFGTALCVVDRLTRPRREIAILGDPGDPATRALVEVARDHAGPGDVIACADPADADALAAAPLLSDRPLVDGAPAAYVCESFACLAPVTSPGALRAALVG